jgi:hypothetical protein
MAQGCLVLSKPLWNKGRDHIANKDNIINIIKSKSDKMWLDKES